MAYTTVLLQKITDSEGEGMDSPKDLNLNYTLAQGCTAGVRYLRAGSTTEGMLNLTVLKNGKVMRYIPPSRPGALCACPAGGHRRAHAGDGDLHLRRGSRRVREVDPGGRHPRSEHFVTGYE